MKKPVALPARILRLFGLWFLMGGTYYLIEIVYRLITRGGWPHWSMIIVGGLCGVAVGAINQIPRFYTMKIWKQALIGTVMTLAVELAAGCVLNLWLGLAIWDYAGLPGNLMGQVCVQFGLIWLLIMPFAVWLEDWLRCGFGWDGQRYGLGSIYREFFVFSKYFCHQGASVAMDILDEIRAREQAATPGPWIYEKDWSREDDVGFDLMQAATGEPILNVSYEHGYDIFASEKDAEFIAHARQDVSTLLDALDDTAQYWEVRHGNLRNDRDRWKLRAEKLEQAVKGDCNYCVNGPCVHHQCKRPLGTICLSDSGTSDGICKDYWQFDAARFDMKG